MSGIVGGPGGLTPDSFKKPHPYDINRGSPACRGLGFIQFVRKTDIIQNTKSGAGSTCTGANYTYFFPTLLSATSQWPGCEYLHRGNWEKIQIGLPHPPSESRVRTIRQHGPAAGASFASCKSDWNPIPRARPALEGQGKKAEQRCRKKREDFLVK